MQVCGGAIVSRAIRRGGQPFSKGGGLGLPFASPCSSPLRSPTEEAAASTHHR